MRPFAPLLLLLAAPALASPAVVIDWNADPVAQLRQIRFAAPTPRPAAVPIDTRDYLNGIASPPDCSGSVVRLARSEDAHAVVLTNGHCWRYKMKADTYFTNQAWRKPITVFARGRKALAFNSTRVLYATQTGTDIALVELVATYRDLLRAGVEVYELGATPPAVGDVVVMASGLYKTVERCKVTGTVHRLKEDGAVTRDSMILEGCRGIDGMSGSPLIAPETRRIVGIFNTGNEGNAKACSDDNPCEIDETGRVTSHKGRIYAQRVDAISTCQGPDGAFDLDAASCGLFRGRN